ncbi:Sulfoacetaldehyde reductase [Salinivirga cyanobacteriivorans]|uniref:Sulfoacetaldehyde reductase n=1 Tax=Salinivirga cyanobacteriivorans TaxID=1307839 RepID=A0A0S2I1G4_9BACT|nr:SDR family oxidoreductase [Salinivirga cyanobacteriivorans]ALO16200.1 Sulfoacetaldehyde reductase [Salinivirga cyanobacteriivorans]
MKKVALITGASSGIGKELAIIHAEKGGDLVLVARSRDKLETLKNELEQKYNVQVMLIVKDLTKQEAPKEVFTEVKNAKIDIDYLINNAGFGGIGKFHERDWEKDLSMINLNITALTALTRFFLPDFVNRNSGKILNVSSTASLMPGPLQAVYYASKAYVTYFSNAIAQELHDTNVTVTTLMPGATETEFGAVSGMDKTVLFDKTANARKVAEDGYKGMMKGKLDVITGLTGTQKVMMSMLPLMPKKVLLKQVYSMQQEK